jgi:hypothetical protein
MQIVHAIFNVLATALRRSRTVLETAVAICSSVTELLLKPWWSGPAHVACTLKDNYLRRIEAGTRAVEANAERLTAEAKLAHVEVAKAVHRLAFSQNEWRESMGSDRTKSH